jgi:hypothetical protein
VRRALDVALLVAAFAGLALLALAVVDYVAYDRFVRSLVFR